MSSSAALDATSHVSLIRTAALALSFLAHGFLFVSFGGALSASHADTTSTSVTRLSFLQPVPLPEAVQEQPEEVIEEPPKKIEKVEKVVEKIPEKKPEKRDPPNVEPQVQQVAASPADTAPQINKGIIRWKRERYLSDVLTHIEHHKWYPKIARRMGIEGAVNVRFMIHANGSAHDIFIENGPETLMAAARKAVERSLPLPHPPAKVDCPIECEFRMRFSLNSIEQN